MRTLLLLLATCAAARAGEPVADPATCGLPCDAYAVVRLASPQRLDAIGRDLQPLLDLAGESRALGDVLLPLVNAARLPVDRSQPVYVAFGPSGTVSLLKALPGTAPEDVRAAPGARIAPVLLDSGWITVREPAGGDRRFATNFSRGVPLLEGDASVCVLMGTVLDRHRARLEEALARVTQAEELAPGAGVTIPRSVTRLLRVVAAKTLEGVLGVENIHYALTWRDGRLESEAWIRSREGSSLRRWLARYGDAKPGSPMGFLPQRAFWMVESSGSTASLDADVEALLDEAFGAGAGRALLLLLSPSYALHEHLTGRAAGVVVVQGMMAAAMRSLHEVKPEAPIEAAIRAIDTEKVNGLLAGIEIPLTVELQRAAGRLGDTEYHRLRYRSSNPQWMMFVAQMDTCFAVHGRYLLVAQSATSETDLRALLDRVRSGTPAEHPHDAAMARLMPDRLEGLSINLGTLKPVLGLVAMTAPEAAPYVRAFPDDLYLSTALAVRDGHIHLRGDWPLKEVVEYAVKAAKLQR